MSSIISKSEFTSISIIYFKFQLTNENGIMVIFLNGNVLFISTFIIEKSVFEISFSPRVENIFILIGKKTVRKKIKRYERVLILLRLGKA